MAPSLNRRARVSAVGQFIMALPRQPRHMAPLLRTPKPESRIPRGPNAPFATLRAGCSALHLTFPFFERAPHLYRAGILDFLENLKRRLGEFDGLLVLAEPIHGEAHVPKIGAFTSAVAEEIALPENVAPLPMEGGPDPQVKCQDQPGLVKRRTLLRLAGAAANQQFLMPPGNSSWVTP